MGKLWITFVVFVVSLAFSHVCFIVVERKSRRFWNYMDYLWLSLTVFSLIMATAGVRMMISATESDYAEIRVRSDLEFAQDFADGTLTYFCTLAEDDQWDDPEGREAADKSCAWYQELASLLAQGIEPEKWRAFVEQADEPIAGHWIEGSWKARSLRQLRVLGELYDEWHALQTRSQPSEAEKMLSVVWPWLLAVALGIRMTKTTAQLVEEPSVES